jgi:hypothetical protein
MERIAFDFFCPAFPYFDYYTASGPANSAGATVKIGYPGDNVFVWFEQRSDGLGLQGAGSKDTARCCDTGNF